MSLAKQTLSIFLLALLSFPAFATSYPSEVIYNIVNNSNVNLTGIPAHTNSPIYNYNFLNEKPFSYSATFGVENTAIKLCLGVGVNNFSNPYVDTYILKTHECTITTTVQKNTDTNYTVTVNDSL